MIFFFWWDGSCSSCLICYLSHRPAATYVTSRLGADLLRKRRSANTGKLSTVKISVSELDTLDVLLLLDEKVSVLEEGLDVHGRLLELWWALPGVDEPLSKVLESGVDDESPHQVIVDPGPKGTEEIDRLGWEGVDELLDGDGADVVLPKDSGANTDTVLSGWVPVELLHTSVTNERSVQGGEIVTSADDRDTWDLLVVVDSWELDVGWVIGDVHEGGVHHLVVHSVLSGSSHAPGTGIKIVDEEGAHLSLLDHVGGLPVPLPDELGWLSGIAGLELTSGHDDGVDTQLLEGQVGLECLSLSLASPDSEDEGNLDLWELHEVLRDVHGELVEEGLGDVVSLGGGVVVGLQSPALVVAGGLDDVVGSSVPGGSLEASSDHAPSALDVELVVSWAAVVGESGPPVLLLGLDSDRGSP